MSLTSPVAKVLEGFSAKSLLMCVWDKLDSKQFAVPGRSTTQALVSVDGGEMYLRMFSLTSPKDSISLTIMCCCVDWIT